MRNKITKVQNILKKKIRASTTFKCILLKHFCVIFIMYIQE